MVADNNRGRGREITRVTVCQGFFPSLLAGNNVERNQVIIRGFEEELIAGYPDPTISDGTGPCQRKCQRSLPLSASTA